MAKTRRTSCLVRVVSFAVILLASSAASAIFIYMVGLGYPYANPVLLDLLADNRIPYPGQWVWAFWTALPCVFSLVAATLIGWIVNWAIGRLVRRRAEARAGSDLAPGGG